MKTFFLSLVLMFSLNINAQKNIEDINAQVWRPFILAFEKNDAALFQSLHLPQLIRVQSHGILNYETYMKGYNRMFEEMQAKNGRQAISLRFTKRLSDSTRAYEEGFYKTTVEVGNKKSVLYGKFVVVLQKENGVWKILMDADTSEDANEKNFLAAKPLDWFQFLDK